MNKWDDELLKIFDEAPFVGIKPAAKKSTVNDRLLRSFDEITEFVERNNRVPEDVGGDEGRRSLRVCGGFKAKHGSAKNACRLTDSDCWLNKRLKVRMML